MAAEKDGTLIDTDYPIASTAQIGNSTGKVANEWLESCKVCCAIFAHGYDGQDSGKHCGCHCQEPLYAPLVRAARWSAAGERAMNKQIWVGLAEVKPQPGCEMLKEGKGAFVHTMAWAEDAVHFERVLSRCFGQMKMDVTGLRQPEPWMVRSHRENGGSTELLELAQQISKDETKIALGTFHAWLKDDLTNQR